MVTADAETEDVFKVPSVREEKGEKGACMQVEIRSLTRDCVRPSLKSSTSPLITFSVMGSEDTPQQEPPTPPKGWSWVLGETPLSSPDGTSALSSLSSMKT